MTDGVALILLGVAGLAIVVALYTFREAYWRLNVRYWKWLRSIGAPTVLGEPDVEDRDGTYGMYVYGSIAIVLLFTLACFAMGISLLI